MLKSTKASVDVDLCKSQNRAPEEGPSNVLVELEVVLQPDSIFDDRVLSFLTLFCVLKAIVVIDPAFE